MLNQNNGLFGDIQGAQRGTVGGMMPTKPNIPAPSPLFPTNSGIVPPGPKQHNFDDPGGGGGPMGGPGRDDRGPGGGPMGFPPGGNTGFGGGPARTPGAYDMYNTEVFQPPTPSPVANPWGHGNDPFNVNGPGGPNSYGNPEGPDGRGFGGGGPMPFPPNGPMGNAPGGPWGGNPNSYGPVEQNGGKGRQIPWDPRKTGGVDPNTRMLPNENQMQPFGGAQGMRDRSGPWSRRLGQAPQGPGLFNPQPQEGPQQQMNPWLRNYLIQRRGL